jgi:exopolyphosphatase/guanosine-5'-triphosphate,3'-diphosphate pyrophosphatase
VQRLTRCDQLSTVDDPHEADVTAGGAQAMDAPGGRDRADRDVATEATTGAPADPVDAEAGTRPSGKSRKNVRRRRGRRRRGVYARSPEGDSSVDATDAAARAQATDSAQAAKSGGRARSAAGPFYAALDLGTNNCRLLVVTPRERGFRVVDAFSRIVRLGEGIGASGRLGEAAMTRSIAALKVCSSKLAERDVRRARLIATEACRTAENGPEFVERVRRETGLELEIVSRQVEASLAVAGCASLVDQKSSGVILFDIGGGSSELVWIDLERHAQGRRRRMSDRIRAWQSLPVGVVNLSERFGGQHVDAATFEDMVTEVLVLLDGFPQAEALSQSVAAGRMHMLGTSGTVTTLAGVHLGLRRYDRRRVDGIWLSDRNVGDLIGKIMAMDYAARVADPCIGRERADLVLSGCAILEAIRRRWPCDRMRVADRGLREGVLVELMAQDGTWRTRSRRRPGNRPHG